MSNTGKGRNDDLQGRGKQFGKKHAQKWDSGIKKELDSLRTRDVFEELTTEEAYHTCWKHHVKTKKLPSQVVFTRKPDELDDEGWKAKARVCACGNFETHTIGKDQNNRAEVPDIFELRLLLALAARNGWSIGSLDVMTAFLYATLDDIEDGIYLVEPPAYLVKHGYIPKGILWKLKKALYGLRKAPKNGNRKEIIG